MTHDLEPLSQGTICLVYPLTVAGVEWLALNFEPGEGRSYLGAALAVEPRYLAEFINFALSDDITVKGH